MAHSAHAAKRLSNFLVACSTIALHELAQQHLVAGENLLEIEDAAAARTTRALIAAVDAIGKARFPREWEDARDNAGLAQESAS